MQLLTRLTELEQAIAYRETPPKGGLPFQTELGRRSVLLSAPHAAAHLRDGEEKIEEEFTAAFARYLAQATDSHAIYATHLSEEDPNWDKAGAYKRAIAQTVAQHGIELVIDLHGMTNRHKIGVAIGTMKGKSIGVNSAELIHPFLQNQFAQLPLSQLDQLSEPSWQRVVLNHPKFTGGLKSHTVTRYVSQTLGISAIQIELTSAARIVHRSPNRGWPFEYSGKPEAICNAVQALQGLIEALVPQADTSSLTIDK